jgi:hypothetical protein
MTHDEVLSIADRLSLRSEKAFSYRPTVMLVHHPCDDAMLSALELEGRGWEMQPSKRVLRDGASCSRKTSTPIAPGSSRTQGRGSGGRDEQRLDVPTAAPGVATSHLLVTSFVLTSPIFTAYIVASAALRNDRLRMRLERCFSTVLTDILSRVAISLFAKPFAMQANTCRSRSVMSFARRRWPEDSTPPR